MTTDTKIKKTSTAKVEANRRNAQNSTGPKTPEGKNRSRWNSLKHGVLSSTLLFEDDKNHAEFELLLDAYLEEFQPDGFLETQQVERIAVAHWRQTLGYRAEAGQARRQQASARWRKLIREAVEFGVTDYPFSLDDKEKRKLWFEYRNLKEQIKAVRDIRNDMERRGGIDAGSVKKLLEAFAGDESAKAILAMVPRISKDTEWLEYDEALLYAARLLDPATKDENKAAAAAPPDQGGRSKQTGNSSMGKGNNPPRNGMNDSYLETALKVIDERLREMELLKIQIEENEQLELDADRIQSVVPSGMSADVLLRYSTTYERQYYRALKELRDIQRERREKGRGNSVSGGPDQV